MDVIAHGTHIEGFNCIGKLVFLDAGHMRSKQRGALYAAIGIDTKGSMSPLVAAVTAQPEGGED
jgi:hypothetical protein